MPQGTFFDFQILRQAQTMRNGLASPDPDKFRVCLGIGAANFNRSSLIAAVIPLEIVADGYQRFNLNFSKTVSSVDAGGNTFTVEEHGFAANDIVLFSGNNLPPPIEATSVYQVTNPTTNTFQVKLFGEASVIDLTGAGSGTIKARHGGRYNTSNQRVELPARDGEFTATVSVSYDCVFGLTDASANAPKGFVPADVNAGTGVITIASHGLTNGEALMLTVDDGGTLPSNLVATQVYYAAQTTTNTFKVATDKAGTNLTTFGNTGSGQFRLRYAAGSVDWFYKLPSTETISANGKHAVPLNLVGMNTAYGNGL